ncbi:sensor histidine kinase YkoH [Virgibacillus pantothenticus]|uniref:HAMP domain-containing histidine kinase n=1 Tax=Virgibacillus TaxID=84406 RepID=UPI00090C26B8|nr:MULTISPECIES: HAMP domain-containing histidine kinase [Virgibacillus]API91674.1 two-component sensor histidine kinase [Virgibacillus sp. 6R]MBS7427785.1 HAMP domain-containing histidine kinase [Virgibacillus sp. 19R1-5]GIP65556.1 sensor histidine kinase YkoH [Virgibacillus pantothenticus]
MKLRTKIQLFSGIFMLILTLIINTAIYMLFYKVSADGQLQDLADQTERLVKVMNDQPDVISNELFRSFSPPEGMIRVVDQDGTIFFSAQQAAQYDIPLEFSSNESQNVIQQDSEPAVAVISKPIIWGAGERAGEVVTIQVSNQVTNLDSTMKTLFTVLLIATIFMLVPIIIGGNVLSRFLLNPIKSLIQTMRENMKEANWKKIHVQNRSKDELFEMEKTFNEMMDHLKDNFERQETFVSDASHELKTPISIVKSYAQLLERRGIDNPHLVKESIEAIHSEADRMGKLVEQMLALAKNKHHALMEQVDIVALIEETVTTFQRAYTREIIFTNHAVDAVILSGNRDQLEQVIYILIDNALKYSEERVEVDFDVWDKLAIIKVRDYGAGIPESEQARIFDRFYRVDKARSRDTGGTGLGLSIAKAIVKEHQGELTVQSTVGEGSTFTVKFPI